MTEKKILYVILLSVVSVLLSHYFSSPILWGDQGIIFQYTKPLEPPSSIQIAYEDRFEPLMLQIYSFLGAMFPSEFRRYLPIYINCLIVSVIIYHLIDSKAGILAALLIIFNPVALIYNSYFIGDITAIYLTFLAMIYILRNYQNSFIQVLCCLAIFIRYQAVATTLTMVVLTSLSRRNLTNALLSCSILITVICVFFTARTLDYGSPILRPYNLLTFPGVSANACVQQHFADRPFTNFKNPRDTALYELMARKRMGEDVRHIQFELNQVLDQCTSSGDPSNPHEINREKMFYRSLHLPITVHCSKTNCTTVQKYLLYGGLFTIYGIFICKLGLFIFRNWSNLKRTLLQYKIQHMLFFSAFSSLFGIVFMAGFHSKHLNYVIATALISATIYLVPQYKYEKRN